jgi:hypothetical protein
MASFFIFEFFILPFAYLLPFVLTEYNVNESIKIYYDIIFYKYYKDKDYFSQLYFLIYLSEHKIIDNPFSLFLVFP